MYREEMEAEVRSLFERLDRVPALPITLEDIELRVLSNKLAVMAQSATSLVASFEEKLPAE